MTWAIAIQYVLLAALLFGLARVLLAFVRYLENRRRALERTLLELVEAERAEWEIARAFEQATGRPIGYGTMYVTLRGLAERGLVSVRRTEDEDGVVRHFKLTDAGQIMVEQLRGWPV